MCRGRHDGNFTRVGTVFDPVQGRKDFREGTEDQWKPYFSVRFRTVSSRPPKGDWACEENFRVAGVVGVEKVQGSERNVFE